MLRKHVAVGFAVILLASIVVGSLALAPSLGPFAAAAQQDTPATQQQTGTCNYQQVFDRTRTAVVSVQTGTGQGSGFVVNTGDNGTNGNLVPANATAGAANASLLVTNAHVVRQASEVTVQFSDGEFRTGTVVGRSAYADLAVVRVADTPGYVTALNVADEDPQRGQPVAALGHPFGLEETITHGIVSGVNRSMPTNLGFTVPNVVQTDAPISPGNSGGPLLTCEGTVVGVNTAGIARQRAENIGFAISPSVVQEVVPQLVENGSFAYPFLGVSTRPVTPAVAQANDLNVTRGVVVTSVLEGGPASGVLQPAEDRARVDGTVVPVGGDVILAVDGQAIRSGEDLASYLIDETEPGDTVEITVLRDGERRTVEVTIGERPELGAR